MPGRPLPKSCSSLTPLYRGALFGLDDWHCAGHDTPGRAEEWCADDRIVVTRHGAWELEIGGDARLADPLTATLWRRESNYRVRHPVAGGDRCTVFRLTPLGSRLLWELFPGRPTWAARTRPLDGRGYLLHRRALERARQARGAAGALGIEEPTLAVLHLVVSGADTDTDAPHAAAASRYVDSARSIIARDFRRPLTVAGIAREVHCSPFHLSRLFRRATGVSLYRAVVRLRLRAALERVLDEPAALAAIALDCGFASHSHFTDAFRAEYGCTPSAARRVRGLGSASAPSGTSEAGVSTSSKKPLTSHLPDKRTG
jgi:AraC family transcriptional regulator